MIRAASVRLDAPLLPVRDVGPEANLGRETFGTLAGGVADPAAVSWSSEHAWMLESAPNATTMGHFQPRDYASARRLLPWHRHTRHDDAAVVDAIVPGHGLSGCGPPVGFPGAKQQSDALSAVARPVTSASRGPARGSPRRCSRPPRAPRRVVLVHLDTDVEPLPGFRSHRVISNLGDAAGGAVEIAQERQPGAAVPNSPGGPEASLVPSPTLAGGPFRSSGRASSGAQLPDWVSIAAGETSVLSAGTFPTR